jgi:hypothetical protein
VVSIVARTREKQIPFEDDRKKGKGKSDDGELSTMRKEKARR